MEAAVVAELINQVQPLRKEVILLVEEAVEVVDPQIALQPRVEPIQELLVEETEDWAPARLE